MALIGSLQVRLGLDTATFSKKLRGVNASVSKFQRAMSGIGNLGTMLGGAGLAASIGGIVDAAATFEQTMNQVGAATEASAAELSKLSTIGLTFGKSSVFSANEVAAAMLDLAKAGLTPAQMEMGALSATMSLAATEGMELSRAAEILAEQMGAFGLSAEDSVSIANALAGASIASTASVDGLAQGLQQTAATASLAGVTLQETTGLLALLAQNGIKGSDAGTSLKTMFLRLNPATAQAAKAMEEFGLSFVNADGTFKSVVEISDILREKLGGVSEAQRSLTLQTIFGTDAYRAAAIMTKTAAGELESFIEASRDVNAANRLAEARTKGFSGAMLQLRNTISSLFIEQAGAEKTGLLKFLTDGAIAARGFVERIAQAPPWVFKLALGLGGMVTVLPFVAVGLSAVAGLIPPLLAGVRGLAVFLMGPWGIALAAAGLAAVVFGDDIAKGFKKASTSVEVESFKASLDRFGDLFRRIATEAQEAFSVIQLGSNSTAQKSADDARIFANSWSEFFQGIAAWATLALDKVTLIYEKTWEFSKRIGERLVKDWYAIAEAVTNTLTAIDNQWQKLFPSKSGEMRELGRHMGVLSVDGSGKLQLLGGSIEKVDEALKKLGQTGERETDRAVGNSWLTDLCQKGIAHFRALVSQGVEPAAKSLEDLGRGGQRGSFLDNFKLSFAPKAIQIDESTLKPMATFAEDFESAWHISLYNTEQAMDSLARNGRLSFKGMLDSMLKDLASAQLQKAVRSIWSGLFGAGGGGGGALSKGGGGWGALFGGVVKAFASFDGGGYTGDRPRTGGLDGKGGQLAMLHPRETVIDHAQVRNGRSADGSGGVNLSVPITLMPGVSREELAKILPEVQKNIISVIPQLIARGGRYAGAFGQ